MYLYRTQQFIQNTLKFRLGTQIDRLCTELADLEVDAVQAHFKRLYPYLKRRGENNLRLIARIRQVGNVPVLCFLDILLRGSKEYAKFLLKPDEYGKQYLDSLINEAELEAWVTSQLRHTSASSPHRPILPPELLPWLDPPGWELAADKQSWSIIYECTEWIHQVKRANNRKHWNQYYEIIAGLVDQNLPYTALSSWQNLYLCQKDDCYVLFSELNTIDSSSCQVLLLISPFNQRPTPEQITEIGQRTNLFTGQQNILARPLKLDELTPFARRSYPSYLVIERESWLEIQSSSEANLALSAEEESILNAVSTSSPEQHCLPLFLNGRAGSGKSTLLSYLFADYCYRKYFNKYNQELPGKPLFLTYNKRLLDVARNVVQQLLSYHHRFIVNRGTEDTVPDVSEFFQPFRDFVLNLLPLEERLNFEQNKHISFNRFRQLYRNSKQPFIKKYSPELAWYTIRTFIKGYNNHYLTPEDYQEEVPEKEQTISAKDFQEIYRSVWLNWYRRLTHKNKFWDDQDLIRRVLELKCYQSDYTAIFCDEAQDFTRLELQLILRLSVFCNYDLGYNRIPALPFAFAGDPLQTLNPTGFRWETVRTAFYSEVISVIDPMQRLNLRVNFPELKANYRSSTPVVQAINLIQLCRKNLFNLATLHPQTAWNPGNFPPPQKLIIGQNIQLTQLKQYLREAIVLIPCEEGEELAYIQRDPLLSQLLREVSSQETLGLKNVLSAIASKGLEFRQVVLYKFGEACPEKIWQLKPEMSYPIEYEFFFNKLYVAASRATEQLLIVDSETGNQKLWGYIDRHLETLLTQAGSPKWRETVQPIPLATPETLGGMAQEQTAPMTVGERRTIALELAKRGVNAEDPELLRRAILYYQDLGETQRAQGCQAWALKYEGKFQEAGELFLQLGREKEAKFCFWEGFCWEELAQWYQRYPKLQTPERAIAKFMLQWENLTALKEFTLFLRACKSKHLIRKNRLSKQWQMAIQNYTQTLGRLINGHHFTPLQWQRFGEALELLGAAGYEGMYHRAGLCFYRAKNYAQAVKCWEHSQSTTSRDYLGAKAALMGKVKHG